MTDIAGMEVETDIREHLGSTDTLPQNKEVESLNNSEDEGICVSHNLNLACGSEAESQPKAKCTSEVNEENQDLSGDDDNVHKRMIVMSDNDSSDDYVNKSLSVGRRRPAILSDDEESSQPKLPVVSKLPVSSDDDESEDDIKSIKKRIVQRSYSESEDDDTAVFLTKGPSSQHSLEVPKINYKYNNDLFDAELSDEDRPPGSSEGCHSSGRPHESDESDEERTNIGKNKKQVKHRPPTLKKQQEEVREIHSESQRMVRDSQVALPYHKPKQRTLTEFLNRRKKASGTQVHMRSSLKMSMRNIETLRLLEEKKKEIEEFYKSDSDQEDPDDQDWKPGSDTNDEKELPVEEIGLEVNLEEEKTAGKLTVFTDDDDDDDELPDITRVIDSLSSTVMDDKSSAEEQQTLESKLPLTASEKCGGSKEDQAVESCDKNDESGIHSGVSSPSDHSQPGDTAVAGDNTASELNTCLLNEGIHNDKDISICENEKNDIVNVGLNEYSEGEGKSLPLTAENSLPVSTASVTKDIKKTNTPKLSLLASKLRDVDLSNIIKGTPKLSFGSEDDFIDLEEEATTPKMMAGVNELMERFVRHSTTKRKVAQKQQVNLSIVSKEKDAEGVEKLCASNVIVNLDAEEEQPTETVPGARLVSLKTALKAKIREQREKVRIRRVKERQFLENEQVIEDHDGDLPDEEAELTDRSDTEYETESEPEENDIIIKDKKHKKSAYVDDEAEDEEDEDMDQADETDNGGYDNDVGPEVEDGDSNDTVEMPSTRKRISVNDDDMEDDSEQLKLHWEESQDVHTVNHGNSWQAPSISRSNTEDLFASQISKKIECVDKDASTTSMDSSFEFFGSVIPGHQPGGGMRHTTGGHRSESESETTFLTPFTKTKSNSFSSTSRERDLSLPIDYSQDSCNVATASNSTSLSPSELSLHLTPLKDSQFPLEESQKVNSIVKLRLDFTDIGGSQKDDLIDLCSGQFAAKAASSQMKDLYEDNLTPTQDIGELVGLCSGQFDSHSERKRNETTKSALSDLVAYDSRPSEGHHSDEEELLNLCTAKFTTQATQENSINDVSDTEKPNTKLRERMEDEEMRPEPQMIVYSSDEEGAINRQAKVKARRKRKRIMQFSDDEDAQDAIDYDDEENEIPRISFSGFKDKMKGGIRADFLENEAELSGSDVNTDDEEDDEDDMEEEEGDLEHYDENELRDQVGRAHLKTVLDSDKREIRLLQEMYLEDGELHGEGRQRQFRWKNIGDDTEEDNERKVLSDEEGGEEETEDAEWRKQKIEREKFLKEQRAKVDDNEPVIFKLNRCPIVRSTSMVAESLARREPLKAANPAPVPAKLPPPSKTSVNNNLIFQSKRGSFLSRDKNTLARIAELTKDKGSVVGGAKQAGNFVFQQMSAEEMQEKVESTKLKKTPTVPISKKPRPDRSFFSMDASSQSSSIFKYF